MLHGLQESTTLGSAGVWVTICMSTLVPQGRSCTFTTACDGYRNINTPEWVIQLVLLIRGQDYYMDPERTQNGCYYCHTASTRPTGLSCGYSWCNADTTPVRLLLHVIKGQATTLRAQEGMSNFQGLV